MKYNIIFWEIIRVEIYGEYLSIFSSSEKDGVKRILFDNNVFGKELVSVT